MSLLSAFLHKKKIPDKENPLINYALYLLLSLIQNTYNKSQPWYNSCDLCTGLCLLFVVFSYYRKLYEDQAASCASLVQQDSNNIKAGYLHFAPPGKPSDV